MFKSKKKKPDVEVEIRSRVIHKKRLRERTWFMWFMLMVFFPVGIYLAWKYHPLGKKVLKYCVVTVLGVEILSVGITSCFGSDNNKTENNTSTFSITRVERNETSIPDEELTVVESTTTTSTTKKTTTTVATTRQQLPWYDYPAYPHLQGYTGLYKTDDGRWAYLNNGVIDVNYNDWAENEYGGYTVVNGFVDWSKPHYSKTTTTTTRYYTTARQSSGGNSGSSSGSGGGSRSPSTARVTEAPNKDSSLVWIPTNGGTKYHSRSGCSGMKNPRQVSRSEAASLGFSACKKCY